MTLVRKRNWTLTTRPFKSRRRNTAIHLACRRQPPPLVIRSLLDCSPPRDAIASRRTADGLTPLHFAAYCGAGPEVVEMLVDRMRSDAAIMKLSQSTRGRQSLGGGVAVMPVNDAEGGCELGRNVALAVDLAPNANIGPLSSYATALCIIRIPHSNTSNCGAETSLG